MNTIGIICWCIAACCYAVTQAWCFMENYTLPQDSFWGVLSWTRKYKKPEQSTFSAASLLAAPNNWYYKLFRIKYKERFLFSASFLVFLTDGYHLFQMIMTLCLCVAACTLHNPHPNELAWIFGYTIAFRICWGVLFSITFWIIRK